MVKAKLNTQLVRQGNDSSLFSVRKQMIQIKVIQTKSKTFNLSLGLAKVKLNFRSVKKSADIFTHCVFFES